MDLGDYLRILRKRWRLVVLCTVLALAAAAGATLLAKPQYQATSRLFVSARTADDISGAFQGGQFTQQRVKSYADIVTTPDVLEPVISKLKLETTTDQLAQHVDASNPLDTVLLSISVTEGDAQKAQSIASAVAAQFTNVVRKLETPDGGGQPLVKATVVQPAQLPQSPISPRPKINLALGLLVGLALGVGLAVLRETLDRTLKSAEDVKEQTGLPLLGTVPEDPQTAERPLVVESSRSRSPRSEAYRTVRTNLQFMNVDKPLRTVVVTSAVPGEGKTTTACNLAIALAEAGKSVIMVEADLRRPRTAEYFGLEGSVGLINVLLGQATLEDVMQPWGQLPLRVLPSGPVPPNPSEILGSRQATELIDKLTIMADVVVLDAPPLLPVTDAAVLAAYLDGAVLVTRHARTTREQAVAAATSLRQVGAHLLGVVVNRVPAKDAGYGYGYGYGYDYDTPARRSGGQTRARLPRSALLETSGSSVNEN